MMTEKANQLLGICKERFGDHGLQCAVTSERIAIVFAQRFSPEELEFFKTYFYCPKCNSRRSYGVKGAGVDFTFYYVPIFPVRNISRFVVCETCKKGFDPDILRLYNQNLFMIVGAAKRDLSNHSPDELRAILLRERLKEEFIDKIMALADC